MATSTHLRLRARAGPVGARVYRIEGETAPTSQRPVGQVGRARMPRQGAGWPHAVVLDDDAQPLILGGDGDRTRRGVGVACRVRQQFTNHGDDVV